MTPDLRPAHHDALTVATSHVERVGETDPDRPTPCAGWDLAALLAHMVGQHRGFAAAVRDGDAPGAAYAPERWSPEAWAASVAELEAAFGAADLDAPVVEVELAPTPLPVSVLVGAQLLDTVVHTWDVARALDVPFTPPAAVVAQLEEMLPVIPDDESRTRPGAAFGPAVTAAADGWDQVLAWLGRDPAWTP
jgi:uncharacterized protein (TIGR03086 family)